MPTIKLERLKPLVSDMRRENQSRCKFEWKVNKAVFDVMLFIDVTPWELLFGAKGENFSFLKEVKSGYFIETSLQNNEYSQLCRVLGLKYDPNNRFSPLKFFTDFSETIPQKVGYTSTPSHADIARCSTDLEESDKIFFCGWLDNSKQKNQVSDSNLLKTRRILGE